MDGERRMWRVATRAAVAVGGVAFFILLSCGEPLAPVEPGWVTVGVLPLESRSGVNSIYARGGPVWAVAYEYVYPGPVTRAKIISYADRQFLVEYESPPEYEYAELADIAFVRYGEKGWAVGGKSENNEWGPYMLKYDYVLAYDGRALGWKEVRLDGFRERALSAVMPINDEEIWVLIDDNYYSGDHDGLLAKYTGGEFKVYNELGPVTAVYPYTRYSPMTLYAVSYAQGGYAPGELPKVYISADGGASWAEETLPEDIVQGREISRAYAGGGFGPDVYILAECGNDAWAVIRRTGAPGAGEYELAFLAYGGPYFTTLNSIAFRNPHSPPRGVSADGVAVGRETSVVFDEGGVYLEKLPYALDLSNAISFGGNGFFAVGKNQAFGGYELLYHP